MFFGIAEKIGCLFKIDRTILRGAEDIVNRRRRIRIVVLGSKNSGKTVFLTALASNLLNHRRPRIGDLDGFNLNQWEAHVEEEFVKSAEEQIPDFPYLRYREGFAKAHPEWPEKTAKEMTVLRLPLVFRKDGHRDVSVLLEFLDLPGERIADLSMVGKSYREWCEWLHAKFAGRYRANKEFLDYLEKARSCQSREELFAAYKEYLKAEHRKFSPWVVPSVVKLTKEGKSTGFMQELDNRPLGLDFESQFVPVPTDFFDGGSEKKDWTAGFTCSYDKYKKIIVKPISRWLGEADQLVYLLDVLNVLKCGVEVYNQERKFGEAVLGLFSRRKTRMVGGAILDYFASMLTTRIKNAYVVVTKNDLAVSEDADNLRRLADELLGKELRGLLDGMSESNIRTCAAVDTIRIKREGDRDVPYARVSVDAPESEYRQVHVPVHWPDSNAWRKAIDEAATYWFDDTWPLFDEREDASPRQRGLDDLVRALLQNVLDD